MGIDKDNGDGEDGKIWEILLVKLIEFDRRYDVRDYGCFFDYYIFFLYLLSLIYI